jgi:hypothetical protein
VSNPLAVATATAALRQLLLPAVQAAVPGADVTLARPHAIATDANGSETPSVNLYLFQVTPNAALRNADLPVRGPSGTSVQRAASGWDLHYLLTFNGATNSLEPERLLGQVIKTLHARPQLDRDLIQSLIASASYPYLASADLHRAVDLLRFRPLTLSLEELSKLWAVFPQTPYSLSVAYVGSAVVIESDTEPAPALPVRTRTIMVDAFRQPIVEGVFADEVANAPFSTTATLLVTGRHLKGDDVTLVRLGGAQMAPTRSSSTALEVSLAMVAADNLRAGVLPLQVLHLRSTASGTQSAGESNPVAVTLVPSLSGVVVTSPIGGNTISFDVMPQIASGQRLSLHLNGTGATSASYSVSIAPPGNAIGHLDVPLTDVAAGTYLVRLRVDGASSLLQTDVTGAYVGPLVNVT